MKTKDDRQEICPPRQTCWLTSTVGQAVQDVAFITETLEAASRVDTEVVAGTVERAFINICKDKNTKQ